MTPQEEKENVGDVEVPDSSDDDDMFGPSRSEPTSSPRPKLSLISAHIRANVERKRVIEISSQKLEVIDDSLKDLRRSICISNTYWKLSDEVRKEKEVRRKRAREECNSSEESSWSWKKDRRLVEDECMALLDEIPELSGDEMDTAQLSRLPALPVPPAAAAGAMLVFDTSSS